MNTPLLKSLKNGTTMYVLPSVAEDKNYENQNNNYKMQISHFALVNFPREVVGKTLDFDLEFIQNGTSVKPALFKDRLVESLRNYVANHSTVIRNSKINSNEFYYDTNVLDTVDEKIFWKWCKKLGVIDFEVANPVQEFFGNDPKYNDNGPVGNTDHYREYLWRERGIITYDISANAGSIAFSATGTTVPVVLPTLTAGMQRVTLTLTASTTLKPGDYILINRPNLDFPLHYNATPSQPLTQSRLLIVGLKTTSTTNDTIIVEIDTTKTITDFGTTSTINLYSDYKRFVQLVGEIAGINNVQHPDRAYTEVQANVSYQHGQMPYTLFNIKNDNNYKPNSVFPILPSEIQLEIQGGETPTNPILTNPTGYPGDIWAQFDTSGFQYQSQTGNIIKRNGLYYGNNAVSNSSPTLLYPDFDGSTIDGIALNLNINDYAEAVSYTFPINSFGEFCATSFNNEAPKDFEFNAILWYYTLEDVSGNTLSTATNLYGIEFLDTPDNDTDLLNLNKIPSNKKWVSNGYQDGNSYTWSLDLNFALDSDVEPPSFDPDKVYSLFGMELYYEAMTRLNYFNDQVTNLFNSNLDLRNTINDLQGLVYTQQSLESIRARMDNLENLLNIYSTLQIGISSTIEPLLDTSVTPPVIRLNSVDKQYGYVYNYNIKDMYTEFINVNSFTEFSRIEKTIPVQSGKDFLVVVNNNDYADPTVQYDPGVLMPEMSLVLNNDLDYKQKIDIIVQTKSENVTNGKPIWNKKLNLYMNYSDGITTNKILLKHLDLPVLQYKSGINRFDEFGPKYNDVPNLKIKNIYYIMPTSAERNFVFTVEDDLVYSYYLSNVVNNKKLQQSMRLFIDNFYLNSTPSSPSPETSYTNMIGQYELSIDPVYKSADIYEIEIVNQGLGYTANKTLIYNVVPIQGGGAGLAIKMVVQTDATGKVIDAYLLSDTFKTTPINADFTTFNFTYTASSYPDLSGTATTVTAPPGTLATFRLKTKKITKINVKINNFTTNATLNTFLTGYDTALGVTSKPLNTLFNINQYCKTTPEMSFLNSWKISMVRISDIINIPSTEIEKRYNIKVERL
jgi:hypothetical protein